MNYETVIGLEVHAQLATRTKIFCGCAIDFGREPNSTTCAVCLGMPGVLPVLNREVVAMAIRASLAMHCEVQPVSQFARKNYFYPDLPKGYQISQYARPLSLGGYLEVPSGDAVRRIHLTRIHLEEDAGKSVHGEGASGSLVDFNRAGVPLIEIVSEPEIRTPQEASDYLKAMRSILRYTEVCHGDMEKGELRCDANVSIRPVGEEELGVKVEIKNMNSFRHVQRAIAYEIQRQALVLDAGKSVVQETRLWNPERGVTSSMRSKEEAHDYRYFPEPDLPPLVLAAGWVDELRGTLPELPASRRTRYTNELGLAAQDADVLTETRQVAELFEAAAAAGLPAKLVANWVMGDVLRVMNRDDLNEPPVSPPAFIELLRAVESGTISTTAGKQVFDEMVKTGEDSRAVIDRLGLRQVSDEASLAQAVDQVIAQNPDAVERYRSGKKQLLGFFVGKVMKAMKGRANPKVVNELLLERLEGAESSGSA